MNLYRIVLVASLLLTRCYGQTAIGDSIYGIWKPYKFIQGQVSALSNKEAHELLKAKIILKPKSLNIFLDICENPGYQFHKEPFSTYFSESYRINSNKLNISKDSVSILTVSCSLNSHDIVLLSNNEIIVFYEGVFYYCKK